MDPSIIEKLRNGNEEARTEFYKQYRQQIYVYCYQLLGNRSDAEDTAHETFIKIFNGINSLQSAAAFRSWVYKIARNESFQLIRKKRPLALSHKLEYLEKDSVENSVESEDIAHIVRRAIDTLKPEFREVILLREYHHLSYKEIADVMKITTNAVKTKLFRARKNLLKKLSPYFGGI